MPVKAGIHYKFFEGKVAELRPAQVLIHGAGGDYLYWPPNIRRLPGYNTYAPDLPGHGKSPGRGHQAISAYSQSLDQWMKEIQLHSAVMVGHSMGAAIALELALNHPARVTGLVLIGGGSRLRVNPDLLQAASSPTTYHNAIKDIIEWSFGHQTPENLKVLAEKRLLETRYSVLHGDLLACQAFEVTDRLADIQVPTLVLCGEQDRMTPPRYSQLLADSIEHASLEIVPDAGHMVMLEQPARVADALLNYLEGITL